MASQTRFECPLCHDEMEPGENLLDHLLDSHTKRELAKYVASEAESREEEDVS